MLATEAMIYCLGEFYKIPEDGYYCSISCYDRNSQPHWVSFKSNDYDLSPVLCTESCIGAFAKSLEPYSSIKPKR